MPKLTNGHVFILCAIIICAAADLLHPFTAFMRKKEIKSNQQDQLPLIIRQDTSNKVYRVIRFDTNYVTLMIMQQDGIGTAVVIDTLKIPELENK